MLLPIDWRPNARQLRTFGTISVVFAVGLGWWIHHRQRIFGLQLSEEMAGALAVSLWALAVLSAVFAWLAPRALRPLYIALTAITLPIGFVVSHVLISVLYYLVVTPIGALLRISGRDPMCRRFDRQASTYWCTRTTSQDPARYLRQY
jgi:Saxitoxin biosynthesis operon protein SxtJ